MRIAVLLSEVNSKRLARSFELVLASLEKLLVILLRQTRKVLGIQKAKRPRCPGKFIRELRAKIYLDALDGIEIKEDPPVCIVERPDGFTDYILPQHERTYTDGEKSEGPPGMAEPAGLLRRDMRRSGATCRASSTCA